VSLSNSRENGATCIAPLIEMAIWLMRCGAEKRDLEAAKRFDLRKPSMSLVMPQSE